MNAPFVPLTKEQQLHRALLWRGHFVQQFGQAELLVGDCLQMFADSKVSDAPVKGGLQIRAAVDEVKKLIRPDGPYGPIGRSLVPSISTLDAFLEWRPGLTHGVVNVWFAGRAGWFIEIRYRECDSSGPVQSYALPFEEADDLLGQFAREVRVFGQRYEALSQRLSDSA